MNIKLFFLGIAFLTIGYLIYRYLVKNQKISSHDPNGEGMTMSNYFGLWGSIIMCFLCGIVFILKSLPSQI
jgi:hypothetical protein